MTDSVVEICARLERVERELQLHRDRAEINEVLIRYARALDWLDPVALESVFFDDAAIDYGFFKGTGREFKPILMDVERAAGRRWHFTSQVFIDLRGDLAQVASYNLSVATGPGSSRPTPGNEVMTFYGYYVDRFERRTGRWGIARRKHLLISAIPLTEKPIEGYMALLNQIGATVPTAADYVTPGG
jgi:hypothetical protein